MLDWCQVYGEEEVNGEKIQVPLYDLEPMLKRIVRKNGYDLMFLDKSMKRAKHHHRAVDYHIT